MIEQYMQQVEAMRDQRTLDVDLDYAGRMDTHMTQEYLDQKGSSISESYHRRTLFIHKIKTKNQPHKTAEGSNTFSTH